MKKSLLILALTFSVLNLFGQNDLSTTKVTDKSFPINIQEGSISELEKFDRKVIAFNGTIEQIENSRNNTPFYKLKLSDNNYLWTVLMFKNEASKIGNNVRIVGFLEVVVSNELNEDEKNI